MDGCCEGAIELIVAVFRLAVADYLGRSYGHDGSAATRSVASRNRPGAKVFLASAWAAYLADQIGLNASAIWREVRRIDEAAQGHDLIGKAA